MAYLYEKYHDADLIAFLRESLKIEGIDREPTEVELYATETFFEEPLTIESLNKLQAVYAPGCPMRTRKGMDVRIGSYYPPSGGAHVRSELERVLTIADPWISHNEFETLHCYIDGNGRVGRALWAKLMLATHRDPFRIGFLHSFYYQTLSNYDKRKTRHTATVNNIKADADAVIRFVSSANDVESRFRGKVV